MQIVIDIPDNMDLRNYDIPYDILNIITSGVQLPKYHGRIVDINKMEYLKPLHAAIHGKITWTEAIDQIKNSMPTIVEAYREE